MIEIEAVTREAFRLRDARDLEGFLRLVEEDCEWQAPGAALRGRAEIRAYLGPFYASFSDDRHELARVDATGTRAWVEGRWRARHTGPLVTPAGVVPATGHELELPFALAFEAGESGLARSIHAYWDASSLLEQLRGAGPAGAEALVLEAFRRMDAGDVAAFVELATEDVEWVIPGATASGRDELAALISAYVEAFPDGRHEPVRLEAVGDTAVVEGRWSGTHTGPLRLPDGEVPSTGATVRFRFCGVLHARDGRIASLHNYFDRLDLLGQLGLVPVPAHA